MLISKCSLLSVLVPATMIQLHNSSAVTENKWLQLKLKASQWIFRVSLLQTPPTVFINKMQNKTFFFLSNTAGKRWTCYIGFTCRWGGKWPKQDISHWGKINTNSPHLIHQRSNGSSPSGRLMLQGVLMGIFWVPTYTCAFELEYVFYEDRSRQ